jgi:hypothetical protein
MPPDAESLERGTHRSDWTIAAHGCNSIVDDVIRNAVTNPATGPGGRLETVAFEIRVRLRDDNPENAFVDLGALAQLIMSASPTSASSC